MPKKFFPSQFDTIDYVRLVIHKAFFEKMMDLNIEKVLFVVKIIDLDTEIFIRKKLVAFLFKIDGSNIYTAMI